jgi:hypothetical protein
LRDTISELPFVEDNGAAYLKTKASSATRRKALCSPEIAFTRGSPFGASPAVSLLDTERIPDVKSSNLKTPTIHDLPFTN